MHITIGDPSQQMVYTDWKRPTFQCQEQLGYNMIAGLGNDINTYQHRPCESGLPTNNHIVAGRPVDSTMSAVHQHKNIEMPSMLTGDFDRKWRRQKHNWYMFQTIN